MLLGKPSKRSKTLSMTEAPGLSPGLTPALCFLPKLTLFTSGLTRVSRESRGYTSGLDHTPWIYTGLPVFQKDVAFRALTNWSLTWNHWEGQSLPHRLNRLDPNHPCWYLQMWSHNAERKNCRVRNSSITLSTEIKYHSTTLPLVCQSNFCFIKDYSFLILLLHWPV